MPLTPNELITPRRGRAAFHMNDFYYDTDKQSQVMRVIEFLNLVVKPYPELLWDRPNNRAPWHWKTDLPELNCTLNVYPHKASWYLQHKENGKVIKGVGWDELINKVAVMTAATEETD